MQGLSGIFKWVGAFAGYFLLGRSITGAFLGFFIGGFIDNFSKVKEQAQTFQQGQAGGRGQYGHRGQSINDIFEMYQRRSTQSDFPTMLMALSAVVMKADGKVLKSELNYVKTFFAQQFGPQFSGSHLQTLKSFLDSNEIPLDQICNDINIRMQLPMRTQLLHYLFGIAKADGVVSQVEMDSILRISNLLQIPMSDFSSIKNMFYRDVESDYKILGIEPSASPEEIKKAYRKMAIRFHPDKVSQMGEEYQKGAKEKFQQIQDAYENLKKQREFA